MFINIKKVRFDLHRSMIEKRKESTSIEKKISCEAIRLNTIKYNPVINTMVDVNRDGLDGWVDGWMDG